MKASKHPTVCVTAQTSFVFVSGLFEIEFVSEHYLSKFPPPLGDFSEVITYCQFHRHNNFDAQKQSNNAFSPSPSVYVNS